VLSYQTSATIAASPETIWSILTDAPGYSRWDSGIERIEGTIAPGERVKLLTEVQPGRAYPVKVGDVEPARGMTWTGGMPLGLFKGVRRFTLTPEGDDSTRFEMREDFSGPLLPLIGRSMPDLGPSFERFGKGLKAEAERSAH
jgi:hypothetical protein